MRFVYIAAIFAAAVALAAPEVSAQRQRAPNGRFLPADHPDNAPIRRPGASLDDGVDAALHASRIGTQARGSSVSRRDLYRMRNRQTATDNKAAKQEYYQSQRAKTQEHLDNVQGKKNAAANAFNKESESFPQQGKDLRSKSFKTQTEDIPALQENIRRNGDRVANLKKLNDRLLDGVKNAAPLKAGEGIVFINMDKRRVASTEKISTQLGRKITPKAAQNFDKEARDLISNIDITQPHILVKDEITGVTIPISKQKFDDLRSIYYDESGNKVPYGTYNAISGTNRFTPDSDVLKGIARGAVIPDDKLPSLVQSAASNIQRNEIRRNEASIKMLEGQNAAMNTDINGKNNQIATDMNKANILKANDKPVQRKFGDEAELNEAELDSAEEFRSSPMEYLNKRRSVTVDVEVDA
jgi:hypothetical protein